MFKKSFISSTQLRISPISNENIIELMAIKNEMKSLMIWATIDEMASYFIISSLSLSHSLTYTQNFSSSFIRNVTFLLAHSVGLFLFNLFLGLFPLRIKWVDATGLMEPFFKSNFFLTKKTIQRAIWVDKKNQKCQFFRFKRKAVKKKKKFIHRRIFNV